MICTKYVLTNGSKNGAAKERKKNSILTNTTIDNHGTTRLLSAYCFGVKNLGLVAGIELLLFNVRVDG